MNMITALALTIGGLAGVATYLCLGTPFGLQVWALFVGWGSFFHSGGGVQGLTKSAINHSWGVIVAALTLLVIGTISGSTLTTSALVAVSVVVLVMGAHTALLATIPAGVYGYASTAAFALLTGVAIGDANAMGQAAGVVLISLIIGNAFGFISEKAGGLIAAKSD